MNGHLKDCTHDDNSMASDNLYVLQKWLLKYPEFRPNELYISGESYAGIYVPFTANAIYHWNQIAKT